MQLATVFAAAATLAVLPTGVLAGPRYIPHPECEVTIMKPGTPSPRSPYTLPEDYFCVADSHCIPNCGKLPNNNWYADGAEAPRCEDGLASIYN
ncbi:hypothetical protein M0657_008744 [Pyricularia oryzae]|nr:hypothetical protein M9X92_008698 [Pyricularia oryzae]KAI7916178.1 hypothetical protein M0657_008744 [Pyricularia oryzae]